MISEEEFKNYINSLIDEKTKDQISGEAKRAKNLGYPFLIVGISLTLIGFVLIFLSFNMFAVPILMLFVFAGLVLIIISAVILGAKSATISKFEKENITKILSKLLEGYDYYYNKGEFINKEDLIKSGFCSNNIDRYSGEDYLKINVANRNSKSSIDLIISDVNAEEEETSTDDDGHTTTSYYTIYGGAFGYVQFNEPFKTNLFINTYSHYAIGTQKVVLEDIEFNRRLKVRCDDQLEARIILTPDVMQKLKDLEKSFKNLRIAMLGTRLYIGAPSTNLFHVRSFKHSFDGENFMQIYRDIRLILGIIDEIKNNDKIFKKEVNV